MALARAEPLSSEPCRFISPTRASRHRSPRPGRGFAVIMSPSTPSPSGPAPVEPGTESIPDRVVRICSRCSRPLSVGERMFYFLEAVNAPCLCRLCVLDQERDLLSARDPESPSFPRIPPPYDGLFGSESERSLNPVACAVRDSIPAVDDNRAIVSELRSEATVRPARPMLGARHLRVAASRYVEQDHLDEAILCIRELAQELAQGEPTLSLDPAAREGRSAAFSASGAQLLESADLNRSTGTTDAAGGAMLAPGSEPPLREPELGTDHRDRLGDRRP